MIGGGDEAEQAPFPIPDNTSTTLSNDDNTVVEVLSDGSQVVEVTTTERQEEEYDIQIQGSDRRYPAIVLRRKHRGKGATIRTISKFGQHSDLYADFAEAIEGYVVRRQARLDNTRDNRENPTTRGDSESGPASARDGWIDQTIQSVVGRRTTPPEDTH